MPTIRTTQIEAAVRAALRAGLRRVRVEVDHARGTVTVEGHADDGLTPPPRSFDMIDFRAAS